MATEQKKSKFILGKKAEMTQIFEEDGKVIPVTVIEAGPCMVTQVRTQEKDGYSAVQIGFGKKKKINKPAAGHLKGTENFRYLREFVVSGEEGYEKGQKIEVSAFEKGEKVDVVGVSKGKGFQGVVKRHGFHGSPATHGHKDQLRMPGSIGATAPARVFKGTRMGGHMGAGRVTVKSLKVAAIDAGKNLLMVKGAVPGAKNSLLIIKTSK